MQCLERALANCKYSGQFRGRIQLEILPLFLEWRTKLIQIYWNTRCSQSTCLFKVVLLKLIIMPRKLWRLLWTLRQRTCCVARENLYQMMNNHILYIDNTNLVQNQEAQGLTIFLPLSCWISSRGICWGHLDFCFPFIIWITLMFSNISEAFISNYLMQELKLFLGVSFDIFVIYLLLFGTSRNRYICHLVWSLAVEKDL